MCLWWKFIDDLNVQMCEYADVQMRILKNALQPKGIFYVWTVDLIDSRDFAD